MPAYRSKTSGNSAGSQSGVSIDVDLPAGVQSGDQLVLGIITRSAAGGTGGWTPAAGWVPIESLADSAGFAYFYRATYGTDITGSGPWNFNSGSGDATTNKWCYACIALDGSVVGDYLTGDSDIEGSSATTHTTPTISPAEDSYLVSIMADRITGGSTWTWPAGWTERSDEESDTGTNAVSLSSATYDTEPASAGSYSVTATSSIAAGNAFMGIFAFGAVAGGTNYDKTPADTLGATDEIGFVAPDGLTVDTVSSTELLITWSMVPNVDGYDLERDGTIISTNQPGTSYSDTGLSPSTTYSYRVRSVRETTG